MWEIVDSNRQDTGHAKGAIALDAYPGLGKTTIADSFGFAYHRALLARHGTRTEQGDDRIPVCHVGLTSNTTLRTLNRMICDFYGHPAKTGTAALFASRALDCILSCDTQLVIVDDVHFLNAHSKDGLAVVNHFKWFANELPVTFLYIGVDLQARGLMTEGLSASTSARAQTARRWTRLTVEPFDVSSRKGRTDWRRLLLGIEKNVILARARPGMIAEDLSDYLFARSTGHTAKIPGQPRKERCRADLSRAKTPTLRVGSRVLAAQLWINDLIEAQEPDDAAARAILADLATVSGRILAQARPESVRQCGARFAAALTEARTTGRIKRLRGLFPEQDAVLAAAALTAAVEVVDAVIQQRPTPSLRSLVKADLDTRSATTPLEYVDDWNFATDKLRSAVIDIYADTIAHVDAPRLRAFSPTPRRPTQSATVATRHRKTPELCWRRISLMLNPGITSEIFREALSVALLLPGSLERELEKHASRLSSHYPGRTSYMLQRLRQNSGKAGFDAICRVADYLDGREPVIDYRRRRQLVGPRLLPERTWLALCRDHDLESGMRGAKLRAARCYLYTTLTGTSLIQAPKGFYLPSNALRMHYESFVYRMDEQLAVALHGYGRDYLSSIGITDEPITWQPPTSILGGLDLPGTHPDSLDGGAVHTAITEGALSCGAVAELFGTTREHIRCILADHPRPYQEPKPRTVSNSSRRYREVRSVLSRQALEDWSARGVRSVRQLSAGGQARYSIDRDWLYRRYVVDRRTHGQIAAEAHVSQSTIERLTAAYGIPNRTRGGGSRIEAIRTRRDATHYRAPLRRVLTGRGAWSRLERFRLIVARGSMGDAADEIGCHASVLSVQLTRLEHEAGSPLWDRAAGTPTREGGVLLEQYQAAIEEKAPR